MAPKGHGNRGIQGPINPTSRRTYRQSKILSEEEATSSDSNDEEYAMAVRDLKKFFRKRGKFFRQPLDDKRNFRKAKEDKKEKDDRRCFKCGDPNHFISDCPKHSFNDQKAFVVGCWSDSEDDSKKEEICLMALDDNEVLSDTPYYSSSSLDNESWQNEYDKLCKISLRIINKNKQLKAKNEELKKEACELKTRVEQLERNKEISHECESCVNLQTEVNLLTLKLASFENSSSSLQEMLDMQKPPKNKHGIGYIDDIASTSNTKPKKLDSKNAEMSSIEPALPVPSAREPASSKEHNRLSAAKLENTKNLRDNIVKKNDSVLVAKKSSFNISKSVKQPPILKIRQGLGRSKIQTHPRMLHRNSNTLYPRSNYHKVGWDYETQQEYQFQPPMFNQWGPYPPFPYMGQPNGMHNSNGPMRYWGPSA
ncbi:zf-CCHC domain-containing protein [Tanacetum coccineum]